MAGSIEFTPPYQDGWQDNEEGATPITADALNNNYDAFLLLLNEWIGNIEEELLAVPDFQISSPSNGQVLKYDSSQGKWVNANESGGGGGSDVSWEQTLQSGTKIGAITINGTPYNVYAPTPPTKTSDLTNDSNFVADASYVHTDNNYTSTEKTKLSGLVAVEANPSGTASTDLTKIAINGTNYNIPSGGGGGTTVIANPSGTPTDELNTIQIGNDIYEIVGGGSGGSGFSRTNLYTASTTETVVGLSQSIEDFDAIELVSWYNYGGTDYTENAIYSALDMKNAIGTAKTFGVYNDAWFTYYRVNDVDELECVANNNSWYVQEIYGLKFGGGSASWTDITGTLTAGSTSITISDNSITTSSTIEVFNDLDVPYNSKTLSTGSITLAFDAQQSDMTVKVRVS